MSFLKYPKKGNNQERNNAIDNIANASDENSLVDAWVDFFSWYPSLWGPNGDSAKKALHRTLSNVVKHKDALDNALGMLDDFYGKTDGIPPKDPTQPTPPRRDPLVLDSDKDGFISTIALEDSNIELGGATLSEASRYIDSNGNRELVADINLEFNPLLTAIDTSTIPDYSVDLDTLTLPNLRGYGLFGRNTNATALESNFEIYKFDSGHYDAREVA
jgi:hypothetical protein